MTHDAPEGPANMQFSAGASQKGAVNPNPTTGLTPDEVAQRVASEYAAERVAAEYSAEASAAGCGCVVEEDSPAWRQALDRSFAANATAAGCGCGLKGKLMAPGTETAWERGFTAAGSSARGVLLQAAREGRIEPVASREVLVPALDLWITVPLDALKVKFQGRALRAPASYAEAVEIGRILGYVPPTQEMVDAIWADAKHIAPLGQTPDESLASAIAHSDELERAFAAAGITGDDLGGPVGKDYLMHERLSTGQGAVIYGWHNLSGQPIQPPSGAHSVHYFDYSHTIRWPERQARRASTGEVVDLLDVYAARWPQLEVQIGALR